MSDGCLQEDRFESGPDAGSYSPRNELLDTGRDIGPDPRRSGDGDRLWIGELYGLNRLVP